VEATHLVINQLRARARDPGNLRRRTISLAAVRSLLEHWSDAESAGVRFHAHAVVVDGVEFRLRNEVSAALKWQRTAPSPSN
jgi:hypothetical protein